LSVDPVTTNAKDGSFFGRYHYANNSPYKYKDPDGRSPSYNIPYDVSTNASGGVSLGDVAGKAGAAVNAASQHVGAPLMVAGAAAVSGAKGKPDFIVTSGGAVVPSSPDKARASLEGAGLPGKGIQNPSGTEAGTIHNVPGMKMDVRIMDGGPVHPPRVVTSREGTSQPVKPENGANFGNVPKSEQRDRSHVAF
jgi:hypothetical protein